MNKLASLDPDTGNSAFDLNVLLLLGEGFFAYRDECYLETHMDD